MKPAIEADLMLLDKVANPYMQPPLEHFTAGIFARTTPGGFSTRMSHTSHDLAASSQR
jgi:hypothetical protein